VRVRIVLFFVAFLLLSWRNVVFSQTASWDGQLSGWMSGNQGHELISQAGLRYIPDVFIEKTLSGNLLVDAEISLNTYVSGDFTNWENPNTESDLKP